MSVSSSRPSPASSGRLISILAMLAAFAPLATDMYLPGFPLMEDHFDVAEGGIEVTLSTFFLGLAIGQAVYGPIIDRFGRRKPLIGGILIYLVATLLCLFVDDIGVFTALRFFQAVGGSAGMIIGRAIVTDLYDRRESARAFSSLLIVMTLAPIIAPILGGIIVAQGGWKPIFWLMLAFGLGCLALVWFLIPETLPSNARKRESVRQVATAWRDLLTDRAFVVPVIVGGLAQACMFAFITGSPFVFAGLHGLSSESYGFLFALVAFALIVFSQINRAALATTTPEKLLSRGLVLNVTGAAFTVLAVSTGSLIAILIPLWFTIGALGLIGANAAAIAMAAAGSRQGSGSALVGVFQFGAAFLVSSIVAAAQNGTAYPMTLALLLSSGFAVAVWRGFRR